MGEQRLRKLRGKLRLAACKQGFADRLERIGNAQRVLMGKFMIRVQTLQHIAVPKRNRLVQKRQHRGRHCGFRRGGRQHFPVLRAAVGQKLPHDMPGDPANIALRVRQKLIEEGQKLLLAAAGHIGAVLLKQAQIGANALTRLLAARLLQKEVKGGFRADGVHQADIILKGQIAQRTGRFLLRQQRRILPDRRRHTAVVAYTAVQQVAFKITQLAVYHLIPTTLFRRDIGKLGQDNGVGIGQRANLHLLLSVFQSAAHAKICVNQKQRLYGQVFELQIPCGVIRRDMRNALHVSVGKPLPGKIVM